MSQSEDTREGRILQVMRKVLSQVIREITPPPGMRHPLSDQTIDDVRQCLALITARERELKGQSGSRERPVAGLKGDQRVVQLKPSRNTQDD